ncbi:MAG: hypothetical protein AAB426_01685 [Myxococcota bacterium]
MKIGTNWGATLAERSRSYPCDDLCATADAGYFRAVTVDATPDLVYRWVCQLRVAPYSYDWIDNGGRQSPHALTPGVEHLVTGQAVMRIFELKHFDTARSFTVVNKQRHGGRELFGEVWVSYVIEPLSDARCRLLAKVLVRYPHGPAGWLMRAILPLGDLVMMRRQLLTLKRRAERDVRVASA